MHASRSLSSTRPDSARQPVATGVASLDETLQTSGRVEGTLSHCLAVLFWQQHVCRRLDMMSMVNAIAATCIHVLVTV